MNNLYYNTASNQVEVMRDDFIETLTSDQYYTLEYEDFLAENAELLANIQEDSRVIYNNNCSGYPELVKYIELV